MEYLVAVLSFLLSGLVGIVSFHYLDRYCVGDGLRSEQQENEAGDKTVPEQEEKTATNTPIPFRFPQMRMGRWLLLAVYSAAFALACFLIQHRQQGWLLLLQTAICALPLLAAGIIDGEIKKIPNKLVLIFLGAGAILLIIKCIADPAQIKYHILKAVLGAVLCLLLFLLFTIMTKGGFGMGDTKLIAALGFVIGIMDAMVAVLFGMLICMFVAIAMLLIGKKTLKDDMPFGPYIFLGYILLVALEKLL